MAYKVMSLSFRCVIFPLYIFEQRMCVNKTWGDVHTCQWDGA